MLNFFTLLEVVGDAGTGTTAGTDATTATMSGAESILGLVLPLLLMVVVFYFLLIRPQKKKELLCRHRPLYISYIFLARHI